MARIFAAARSNALILAAAALAVAVLADEFHRAAEIVETS